MESLEALTMEAGVVVEQQEKLTEEQVALAAALQEVKERKEKQEQEVRRLQGSTFAFLTC